MIFLPLQENFDLEEHVNTGFTNAILIVNKAFEDFSVNIIDEPKTSTMD